MLSPQGALNQVIKSTFYTPYILKVLFRKVFVCAHNVRNGESLCENAAAQSFEAITFPSESILRNNDSRSLGILEFWVKNSNEIPLEDVFTQPRDNSLLFHSTIESSQNHGCCNYTQKNKLEPYISITNFLNLGDDIPTMLIASSK